MLIYHSDLKESLAIARRLNMDLINSGHITEEYYSLENRLEYLKTGGNFNPDSDPDYIRCHLYSGFMAHSFGWSWYRLVDVGGVAANDPLGILHPELVGYKAFYHGGLIFHRDYHGRNKGTWAVHS